MPSYGEPSCRAIYTINIYQTVLFLYLVFIAQPCNPDGATRLLNFTSDVYAGFVQVCLNRVWGTVCADSPTMLWSEKNAQVFCIGLGYGGALNSVNQSTYGICHEYNSFKKNCNVTAFAIVHVFVYLYVCSSNNCSSSTSAFCILSQLHYC